ncbi:MAG: B12-binding domain-containing radical SAM protein [Flavobacteriaceae bacterium]|nr:B12-binding domain-containing radical SAM protein [Flavobacteriaceae bacterium]
MPKVLICNTYFYRFDHKQWKNQMPYPPLGTLYAASSLEDQGYDVRFFDNNLVDNANAIQATLNEFNPGYLVIYDDGFNYLTKMCLTVMREACFSMLSLSQKRSIQTLVSSSDSTDHYEMYLNQGADVVLLGEAEESLLETLDLLNTQSDLSNCKGIAYKNDTNEIQANPRRPVLRDLDSLPMPNWDLINVDEYRSIWSNSKEKFSLNIATTRGCPYKCNWCAKPIYGNRYNAHSPEYIVSIIEKLYHDFGVNRFWMCDDIFGLKPGWVQKFGELLNERQLKISYYIQSRVDLLLKEDTIDVLANSGLEEVWLGAESGAQEILDAMDKGTQIEDIYKATELLKKRGVKVAFFLQFGYPGETKKHIKKTIDMVKLLLPDNIGISVSYPLPGTKFYDKVKEDLKSKANWKDSDDLDMMFTGTYEAIYYKRLQRYVHKVFRKQQGLDQLKKAFLQPNNLSFKQLKSISKLLYYIPSSYFDKVTEFNDL